MLKLIKTEFELTLNSYINADYTTYYSEFEATTPNFFTTLYLQFEGLLFDPGSSVINHTPGIVEVCGDSFTQETLTLLYETGVIQKAYEMVSVDPLSDSNGDPIIYKARPIGWNPEIQESYKLDQYRKATIATTIKAALILRLWGKSPCIHAYFKCVETGNLYWVTSFHSDGYKFKDSLSLKDEVQEGLTYALKFAPNSKGTIKCVSLEYCHEPPPIEVALELLDSDILPKVTGLPWVP